VEEETEEVDEACSSGEVDMLSALDGLLLAAADDDDDDDDDDSLNDDQDQLTGDAVTAVL